MSVWAGRQAATPRAFQPWGLHRSDSVYRSSASVSCGAASSSAPGFDPGPCISRCRASCSRSVRTSAWSAGRCVHSLSSSAAAQVNPRDRYALAPSSLLACQTHPHQVRTTRNQHIKPVSIPTHVSSHESCGRFCAGGKRQLRPIAPVDDNAPPDTEVPSMVKLNEMVREAPPPVCSRAGSGRTATAVVVVPPSAMRSL
eukprot:COSAG01_NODE_348_length_18498_cov_181.563128_2_plen_199_part_00